MWKLRENMEMHVSSKEKVKGVWKNHFNLLINKLTVGEAIVSSMGMEAGGKEVYTKRNQSKKSKECNRQA